MKNGKAFYLMIYYWFIIIIIIIIIITINYYFFIISSSIISSSIIIITREIKRLKNKLVLLRIWNFQAWRVPIEYCDGNSRERGGKIREKLYLSVGIKVETNLLRLPLISAENESDAERVLFAYGYGANVPSTAKRRMQQR